MVKQHKNSFQKVQHKQRTGKTERQRDVDRWIKPFIAQMSDPFLAELVVQEDHELLFNCKTGGIRIKTQKANDFTPSELSQIQHALTVLLESRKVLIFPNKPKVNLHQVVTLGIPFRLS